MNVKQLQLSPLKQLQEQGQSVWLDYIRRSLITSGELKRMLDEDGLRGMTSNPAIFEKAIAGSTDYADVISDSQKESGLDANAVYERIAIRDIQDAADILRPVYDQSKARDGYVSLEVSPLLAFKTVDTVNEAKRLWKAVNRPNVMIKVPGTPEGVPAFEELIGSGINVNVTLLFSQDAYQKVAEAYMRGLEKFASTGGDVSKVNSVASFFVSRIDSLIDEQLGEKIKSAKDEKEKATYQNLMGKVAIANAKMAYAWYQDMIKGARWQALAGKGAQTQRLLWASTSTKNPTYRDVIYVEELIGPDTVNTIPPATFDAFRDHGRLAPTLTQSVDQAKEVMENLEKAGISMKKVTDTLLEQGVKLFADAFEKLLSAVEKQRKQPSVAIDGMKYSLPADLDAAVKKTLEEWDKDGKVKKLWARDASLWTNEDESKWLDWLNITKEQIADIAQFKTLADDVKKAGFTDALLLGMGGSSLCPEVLEKTFPSAPGYPKMHVLDSTDPAQVKLREKEINVAKTIFIVSSKSGSTLEPNIYKQYFFELAKKAVGADKAGSHFITVTDPGSKMQQVAEADKFRHIAFGSPGIGGRYSALSDFGMVPAAVMGIDVAKLLNMTDVMVEACQATVPAQENPGVLLGTILGVAAKNGRDKVTLITSPGIGDLGAWLEQLLAESTGKVGKGLIPVDREEIGAPGVYGKDRVFAYLRLESAPDTKQDEKVRALMEAGQPVVFINVPDIYNIGQEFFRWEIATAVAGSIIGINAFNQPDVEASKIVTRQLTEEYEKNGSLPAEAPILEDKGIKLFTDKKNADELAKEAGSDKTLEGYLRAHMKRIKDGDYFALLAYILMNDEHEKALQEIRIPVRDKKRVATCLGFGPRFLHSTGQAYKGGPNSGVFLQITCDDAEDLPVPGQKYTFGIVKAAQARGDFQVLADRNRRALRVHLGKDVKAGLKTLREAMSKVL
jgi:transaldolase / glucose-6-phosphate isomerase